jgi:hypothetical protein
MKTVFSFLKKFWIPIAIVVLYVMLAGFNILPSSINIFKKKKLLIDDTPVIVKEIRELGQLSTSEFYGEVYADINEVYDDVINQYKDSIAINPNAFYKNYSGLKDYKAKADAYELNERQVKLIKSRYDSVLKIFALKLEDYKANDSKLSKQIAELSDDRKEKRALSNQLDALKQDLDKSRTAFMQEQALYVEANNNIKSKRDEFSQFKKDRNLVYIGRGWVKAGLDLKQLSEENIIIEHGDSVEIQILLDDPSILDADINPWFIYTDDKKIKGFEVFMARTGSIFSEKNFTDYEVTQLKLKCKEKLKEAALEKGLLKNAKSSAIQTLENFFHIIGYQKVSVHFKSSSIIETTAIKK